MNNPITTMMLMWAVPAVVLPEPAGNEAGASSVVGMKRWEFPGASLGAMQVTVAAVTLVIGAETP